MAKLNKVRREFIEKATEVFGDLSQYEYFTREDLIKIQEMIGKSGHPAWIVNDSKNRRGRGRYAIPTDGYTPDSGSATPTSKKSEDKKPVSNGKVKKGQSSPLVFNSAADSAAIVAGYDDSVLARIPAAFSEFVPWGHYDDVKRSIEANVFMPTFISGLSGNGKTLMVEQICAELNRPFFRVNITKETEEIDLIGGFRLKNGETVWEDGPVTEAFNTPNAVLLLDEIDLGGAALMCLQAALEGKDIFIKKTNRVVKRQPGVTIIATANTKGRGDESGKFAGTNYMNEAMLERFPLYFEQPYPNVDTEKKILVKVFDGLGYDLDDVQDLINRLGDWSEICRKSYLEGACDDMITTRRLVMVAKSYAIYGDEIKAVSLAVARFDKEMQDSFLDVYKKLMPVDDIADGFQTGSTGSTDEPTGDSINGISF